jgi:hypothetical protein
MPPQPSTAVVVAPSAVQPHQWQQRGMGLPTEGRACWLLAVTTAASCRCSKQGAKGRLTGTEKQDLCMILVGRSQ